MARADYAHHNEEADRIWYEEEGKHSVHVDHWDDDEPTLWSERDDPDEDDYETEAKVDENTPDTGTA